MSFLKLGELVEINPSNLESFGSVEPLIDEKILADFQRIVTATKRVAPKADNFLYFSAVMMHAAEASLVNSDGTPRLTSKGEAVRAHWDKTGGSFRWKTNDPSIKPYKNSNGDIFPEEELIKAYKKWIGKPLCVDHKSSSIEHVRGFIVDTYYDRSLKRVIALCALDKLNYPDLARKVSTGYSNSVSMGTAVGKAICSDCGTVARTEADFCKCMRGRSCYGEINVDLNPIELSIVVNGADPQARIKDVLAAAENLNTYVDMKTAELEKLADYKFTASLNFTDPAGQENGKAGNVSLSADSLEDLQSQVQKAFDDFAKITEEKENIDQNTNDTASNQTGSTVAMHESEMPNTDSSLAPPTDRFASDDLAALDNHMKVIKSKLDAMQEQLLKVAAKQSTGSNKKEEIMSGNNGKDLNKQGYFQGAGGENEPTPGQVKYTKDPLNEQLRNNEDRQMVGQKPFPDVGPVDGMYPGYESFDKGELERKKMLARAQSDERASNRKQIVEAVKSRLEQVKEGYYQGGGDVNEPTPGKQKYPVDKQQEIDRDKNDKQMVGQKPFPGVGPVDGLHPSPESADVKDELKRKEMLLRAALKARFVKASKADGSHDLGNSAWEVYLGDKLVLTASVNEITDGRADALYSAVATKEFATDLIGKVRKLGAEKVASLYKKAQDAGAPPAPMPPTDGPGAPPALPEAGSSTPPAAGDASKDGDPKEKALDLADKAVTVISDLNDSIKELTGEQSEMGDIGSMKADDSAGDSADSKISSAHLLDVRKNLNSMLLASFKEAVATLTDHEQELRTVVSMYEKGAVNDANKDLVNSLVEDAIVEAKSALADSFQLLGAFVKYARGTTSIKKCAELTKNAHGEMEMEPGHKDGLMAMVEKPMPAADALDAMLAEDMESADFDSEEVDDDNDAGMVHTTDPMKAAELAGKGLEVTVASLETRAARDAERAKIAAEMKWEPMLNDFHKHLDGPHFDVKPSDKGDEVETIEEVHDAVLNLAEAPPKVRKEAEMINQLITTGQLDVSDLDLLVANGVDPAAVKYWKQFYGEMGSEGSQFASELVKEHAKAQAEEAFANYRVKLARAYELTYEMVDRELVDRNRTSISNQVDEIMKWNDESFDSVKRVIANQKPTVKTAGRMPQVGFIGTADNTSSVSEVDDFAAQLQSAFSRPGKGF